ncbi:hypothetical protein AAU61_14310 [Desulfocarbo indianensis]|nr:hypothetical protein AAU61_14310 [Desulfocarbo indianensis]
MPPALPPPSVTLPVAPWVPAGFAAELTHLGEARLKALALAGEIEGYQDPDDKRGGLKSKGRWWIYLPSVWAWHDRRSGRKARQEFLDRKKIAAVP